MPIYENAKSTQIRVAVSVGGALRQRYFYPKTPEMLEQLRKEARQLNMEWKFEANLLAPERKRECKETGKSSAYVTGVRGIKMKFVVFVEHLNPLCSHGFRNLMLTFQRFFISLHVG
jgi:hypothetical protein